MSFIGAVADSKMCEPLPGRAEVMHFEVKMSVSNPRNGDKLGEPVMARSARDQTGESAQGRGELKAQFQAAITKDTNHRAFRNPD
jgi:hypothetical protein